MSLHTPPRLGPRLPLPPAPGEDSSTPDALGPGDVIDGRYQIEECVGEGGVGLVFRALQIKLHRRVAIKLLSPESLANDEMRPRFQQEALTLAALSHPNIVALQDYGVVRGHPFLVLELLEGRTLRTLLDESGPLEPRRALALVRQVVLALAYAHERGIVHRDLKPANVIVQTLPAYEHVKVLDFGMVKLLPSSQLHRGEALTRAGFTAGTPAYMSPEHATGAEVDGRADLYSVGILLFELLTGDKPFDGEIQDVLRAHLTAPVPPLAERRPALAGCDGLEALIARTLAKARDERVGSALELLGDIDALLASPRMQASGAPVAPAAEGAASEAIDDGDDDDDDALARSLGLAPRLHGAVARGGALWRSLSGTVAEQARTHVAPRWAAAQVRLRAFLARLGPRLRRLADVAWARARPRIVRAAERIAQLALAAKARIEQGAARPETLAEAVPTHSVAPPHVVEVTRAQTATARPILALPADATVNERTNDATTDRQTDSDAPHEALSTDMVADSASDIAQAERPARSARDTAEPLVLEPRDPSRSSRF